MGKILKKKKFSPQSEAHTAKLGFFFLVLKHFLEIHREPLFLVKKVAISERNTKYSEGFIFLTCLKRGKS